MQVSKKAIFEIYKLIAVISITLSLKFVKQKKFILVLKTIVHHLGTSNFYFSMASADALSRSVYISVID